jgi:hypothetical protein
MKSHTIIFMVLICLYSCDNQKKQDKLISNNHTKYWNKNGSYQKFYYYKNNRFNDKVIDIVYDRSWTTLNDSSFILSKKKARILTLTKDTFTFQLSDRTIVKLAASQNQTDTLSNANPFKENIIWDTIRVSR